MPSDAAHCWKPPLWLETITGSSPLGRSTRNHPSVGTVVLSRFGLIVRYKTRTSRPRAGTGRRRRRGHVGAKHGEQIRFPLRQIPRPHAEPFAVGVERFGARATLPVAGVPKVPEQLARDTA